MRGRWQPDWTGAEGGGGVAGWTDHGECYDDWHEGKDKIRAYFIIPL